MRFRNTPTFGRDTFRKITYNVSLMKQLAARDYEDILQVGALDICNNSSSQCLSQCAIPAFECLLPKDDNDAVLDLLFLMATFHAYAKLRLHTESTVESLELVTIALCQALRRFSTEVCPRYQTKELPREVSARARRETSATMKSISSSHTGHARPSAHAKIKQFNMNTTKIHSLPDYAAHIRRFGTTDSYTTQTVSPSVDTLYIMLIFLQSELAHRLSKKRYMSSNKNKRYLAQVTNKENQARFYLQLKKRLDNTRKDNLQATDAESIDARQANTMGDDELQRTDPSAHYYIGTRTSEHHDLTSWLHENAGDPAFKVCHDVALH
jgi:hypothetical protein